MARSWSIEEIQFLENSIGTRSFTYIAKALGRTETSIIVKAKRLKLGSFRANMDYISITEFAEMLGVGRKMAWYLVDKKKIPSVRKYHKSNCQPIICIKYDDAVKFVKTYQKQQNNRWTPYEVSVLKFLKAKGLSIIEIANKINRSKASVAHKLSRIKSEEAES